MQIMFVRYDIETSLFHSISRLYLIDWCQKNRLSQKMLQFPEISFRIFFLKYIVMSHSCCYSVSFIKKYQVTRWTKIWFFSLWVNDFFRKTINDPAFEIFVYYVAIAMQRQHKSYMTDMFTFSFALDIWI